MAAQESAVRAEYELIREELLSPFNISKTADAGSQVTVQPHAGVDLSFASLAAESRANQG